MTHTQAILITYLSPTDTKGTRIKLTDKRFKTSITLAMDYSTNPLTQAKEWLEARGYSIHTNSTFSDDVWLVTVTHGIDGRPPFKNIKEATA